MAKTLSIADINALRILLKRANKPASLTQEQYNAKRNAARKAYKATVLAWAIEDWHRHKAHLQRLCPDLWAMGLDEMPTVYTLKLAERYKRRDQLNY
jgi:hypothetical protein